ncbi:amidase [Streptomyces cavernicola]|uniref:Amidase n=1 Tax=Streptomyces cavernicola TaxID=3043613 RepID=A0ABT6S7C6_9ACTN|nr:amidase [Streptomyces sp. B-S-A6]MDI3403920.1 amidase [Streptomyces sp. B-S-A6]
MTSWAGRTAAEIAAAVREGDVSPRHVVADHLARIDLLDARVGAFRTVRAAAVLAEADALAARADLARLPLAGVPVAVKDNLPVRGEACRNGSAATSADPAAADHVTVARLRAAGALVIGLTNVPELCVFGTTDGVHGAARNPWDLTRTAGGSSGGSAAAVAAGMAPLGLGNDGMGSIRIPAAHCGVLGLKPGSGTVPRELGGGWFGMSENGPLATTVEDARLMLSVLADAPSADAEPTAGPTAGPASRPSAGPAAETAPLRIAVSAARSPQPGVPVTHAYATAAREAGKVLAGLGHSVDAADPPYPMWLGATALAHWSAGTYVDTEGLDLGRLARRTRVHAALGARCAAGVERSRRREQLRERFAPFFERYDVLLTPALARRGPRADPWHKRGWLHNVLVNTRCSPLTPTWNLTGWPALTLPFGYLSSGAPCAVQLVGAPGREGQLLDVAAALEAARPWQRTADVRP